MSDSSANPGTSQGRTEPHLFERFSHSDARLLIEEYPLAWVTAPRSGAASLLPLVGVFDDKDRLTGLIGHFARHNPLEQAFAGDPEATILFTGPQGYISSDMTTRRNWAPTWNYAQLRIAAKVTLEPERTEEALQVLLGKMEQDTASPWQISALGDRYPGMLRQIVGFRADVVKVDGRFKLGQDEDLETLRSIIAKTPDRALARWMERLNRERLREN